MIIEDSSTKIPAWQQKACALVNKISREEYYLDPEKSNKIGRGLIKKNPDFFLSLTGKGISKLHASITCNHVSREWSFKDHSSFGSKVNGEPINNKEVILRHGDIVAIGEYFFEFYDEFIDEMEGTQATRIDDIRRAKKSWRPFFVFLVVAGIICASVFLLFKWWWLK